MVPYPHPHCDRLLQYDAIDAYVQGYDVCMHLNTHTHTHTLYTVSVPTSHNVTTETIFLVTSSIDVTNQLIHPCTVSLLCKGNGLLKRLCTRQERAQADERTPSYTCTTNSLEILGRVYKQYTDSRANVHNDVGIGIRPKLKWNLSRLVMHLGMLPVVAFIWVVSAEIVQSPDQTAHFIILAQVDAQSLQAENGSKSEMTNSVRCMIMRVGGMITAS